MLLGVELKIMIHAQKHLSCSMKIYLAIKKKHERLQCKIHGIYVAS